MREKIDYSNMSMSDNVFGVLDIIDYILGIECYPGQTIDNIIYCEYGLFRDLESNPTMDKLKLAVSELIRVIDTESVSFDKCVWDYLSAEDNDYINYLEEKYL